MAFGALGSRTIATDGSHVVLSIFVMQTALARPSDDTRFDAVVLREVVFVESSVAVGLPPPFDSESRHVSPPRGAPLSETAKPSRPSPTLGLPLDCVAVSANVVRLWAMIV